MSWFDLKEELPRSSVTNLFTSNDGELKEEFQIPRFNLIDFGSTRLGVESEDSDLDLLVTTYDCLFERLPFFLKLEAKMK